MRTHRAFPDLQPWTAAYANHREALRADALCAMRIEPVMRARKPTAVIDLHFTTAGAALCIPLIYLDLAQLDVRESDPLVFPAAVAPFLTEDVVGALLERLFPDLEARAVRGGLWREELVVYRPSPVLDAARERGLFGAAPLGVALPLAAPAVYARRFALDKHVIAYGPGGTAAAAFLKNGAASCVVTGDDDPVARDWFGALPEPAGRREYALAIGSGSAPAAADVIVRLDDVGGPSARIMAAAVPTPADVMIAFDLEDEPAARRFAVEPQRRRFAVERPPLTSADPVGGSAGRIAVVVRPDAWSRRDADTDEAESLVRSLRAEGFTVTVTGSADDLADAAPDLVHLFGVVPGAFAGEVADWTSVNRVALAVHAYYEAPDEGGYWGTIVSPYCFNYSPDDRSVSGYLDLLAKRLVEVDGVTAASAWAPPRAGLEAARRVLRLADIVFVNSERERAVVSALRPGRPTIVVPPLPLPATLDGPADPIEALVGLEPFILVHGPIGPESNVLTVVRASAAVGVPTVLAGPVADPAYAERLRECAGGLVRVIGEPTPAECRSLYRAAAVVADASWVRRGQCRSWSAAALGVPVVVPAGGWTDLPIAPSCRVDPADVEAIARGLGEAWDLAGHRSPETAGLAALAREAMAAAHLAVAAGYAKIGQTV